MELQEAKNRGTDSVGDNINLYVLVDKQALTILIEAAKRVLSNEFGRSEDKRHYLPGETKE